MNVSGIYKIIGAIVGALVIIIGIGFIAKIIYTPNESNGSGNAVSVTGQDSGVAGTSLQTTTDAVDTASRTAAANTEQAAGNTTSRAAQPASVPATTNNTNQAATATAEPAKATATTLADASSGSGGASALAVLLANASVDNGKQIARKCTACHDLSKDRRNKFGSALYGIVGSPIGADATYKYSKAFKALAAKGDIWTYAALDKFLTKPREDVKGTKMSFRGLPKPEDRADLLAYLQTLSPSPVPFP